MAVSENQCCLDFPRSLSSHTPDAVTISFLWHEKLLSLFTNCLEEKEGGNYGAGVFMFLMTNTQASVIIIS